MPVYSVKAPDGRSFDLEGDSPPTEQELEQVFSSLPKARTNPAAFPGMGQFPEDFSGLSGITGDKPAAAAYGALQEAGRIPGGLADIIVRSAPGIQLASSLSDIGAGKSGKGKLSQVINSLTSPIQDLTPKVVQAVGFDPNNPENPQFKEPGAAALGEVGFNVATTLLGGAKPLGAARIARTESAAKAIEDITQANNTLSTLVKFTPSETPQLNKLDQGIYAQLLPDVKAHFKTGSGVKGAINAIETEAQRGTSFYKPVIENADAAKYFNPEEITTKVDQRLQKYIPESKERAAALETLNDEISSLSPDKILPYAKKKNQEIQMFYKNPDANRSGKFFADKAARDVYSEIIKIILSDSNIPPEIYSRTGNLYELSDALGERALGERVAQMQLEGSPLLERAIEGAKGTHSIKGGAIKSLQNMVAPHLGGKPKFLNNQVERMFQQIKKAPSFQLSNPSLAEAVQETSANKNVRDTNQTLADFLKQQQEVSIEGNNLSEGF